MSYADVAASGPKQSPQDVIHNTDDSTHSLVDVDTPHVASVPSDFESQPVKTETQLERLEREAVIREEAKAKEEKAKAKAKKGGRRLRENADNPVVIGNAVTIGVVGAALGFGAYKKYNAGELSWKLAGAWAGAVGLFGVAEYYLSKYVSFVFLTDLANSPGSSSRNTPRRTRRDWHSHVEASGVFSFLDSHLCGWERLLLALFRLRRTCTTTF
ncbi:hypothetical protein BKA81DRAFT_307867 [Phyllosticta paracitricarpa]